MQRRLHRQSWWKRKGEKEKWMNRERYKVVRKEAKLVVTAAKMIVFERLHVESEDKGGDKSYIG